MRELDELRKEIDRVDRQIVSLLNERYNIVKEVGEWKHAHNQPVYVPEREKMLLEKLESTNPGPMPNPTLRAIYREIMSGAIRLEEPLKVAYLGPEATYTHLAAKTRFGNSVEYVSRVSIPDVFHEVENNRCNYGVVPVENSTEGVVNHTLDLLTTSDVNVCGEIDLDIRHCLLSKCSRDDIRVIYGHSQALEQCRNYLDTHFPGSGRVPVLSNARACQMAVEEPGAAAIAGILASEYYHLDVVDQNIQDHPDNATRFLLVGSQIPAPSGSDKTSIVFSIHDRAGGLQECLECFSSRNISLSMIDSRPLKKRNWEYMFFVDLAGHRQEPQIAEALAALEEKCTFFKVLGSYPKAIPAIKE